MAFSNGKRTGRNERVNKKRKQTSSGDVEVPEKQLSSAVEHANKIGALLDKRLSFDIDRKTNRVAVRVTDESTGRVVRIVPPDQMLRMAAHLKKLKVLNDRVIGAAESVIFDQDQ